MSLNDKYAFPCVAWDQAQPGDRVGSAEVGEYTVIIRRLKQKWRAERVAYLVPGALVWADGHRHWAVVLPQGNPSGSSAKSFDV